MNVANLQIEGLTMALALICQGLVRKGLLSVDEVDEAMRKAEASLIGDERVYEDMSPASRDAICFPIRLVRAANLGQTQDNVQSFAELAATVGRTKRAYGDQL